MGCKPHKGYKLYVRESAFRFPSGENYFRGMLRNGEWIRLSQPLCDFLPAAAIFFRVKVSE